jgi:pyruvate formate lyase activating enzyme
MVKCNICERRCIIEDGKTGACGLYKNEKGHGITENNPNQYLVTCPISIETMPLLHFYPSQKFLQISTVGCNFDCPGCISTVIVKDMKSDSSALHKLSPAEIVHKALENHCVGIAFLMNDPIASYQTFLNVAKAAKEEGLLVGCSSNTYFTEESLMKLIPYLDFINIGIKGMTDDAYMKCGAASVEPVMRNIRILYQKGVHIEVSMMCNNSNKDETVSLAQRLHEISSDIPLQMMRFIPLEGADCRLEPSIKEMETLQTQLTQYLDYVYLFNSPGTELLNTYCPKCKKLILERDFYGPMGAKLKRPKENNQKNCSGCGYNIRIKNNSLTSRYQEGAFQGGYPFTRALEMIEAILITIGVNDKDSIIKVWEYMLSNQKLEEFHVKIQDANTYLELIENFGKLTGHTDKSEKLTAYLRNILAKVQSKSCKITNKPRVYYAMGKPLFCIKGERLENKLVEISGGVSVAKELDCTGRPGMNISVEQLNLLNPDVIFISAFISNSVEDFYEECVRLGVNANAVKHQKIYAHLAPGWDFGSPRWILGLMYIANILHPELYNFDVMDEATRFYKEFYYMRFSLSEINRSFAKPSYHWKLNNYGFSAKEAKVI